MSKYAIIKIGPFQYTVNEGEEYSVPKFEAEEGKKIILEDVLAIGEGDNLQVGTPKVEGAKVTLMISEQAKGEKIKTSQFKSKSRYRRTVGHRKRITKFKVEKISAK